jgi:CubicO group peptidase (beta-lactamase class C family)
MKTITRYLAVVCLLSVQVHAQLTTKEIDDLVHQTLSTFHVPGIAVCVIKDKQIVHAKGYGVRSLLSKQKVDEHTLFGIASNSKAITAAGLGILVEEGKLSWDSKVTDFIPEFKMYDPYVTAEFTVRDLLTHRSGLGLGAGDLMFWPDQNDFSKADIIHNLRYLKPVSSFRSKYDYDNLLYIVAGEVLARVSGMSWEAFIQERIFNPLGMKTAAPSFSYLKDKSNVIDPHFFVDGTLQVIRRDWSENANAAGGIYASVSDMAKWMTLLLNRGKYGDRLEKQLFSEGTLKEVWSPQTLLPLAGPGPYGTNFAAYGLGWVITDVLGHKQLGHTGGLAGIVTQTTLIPDLDLAILVYTNQQEGAAFSTISNTIKDAYLGAKHGIDWLTFYRDRTEKAKSEASEILRKVESELSAAKTASPNTWFDPKGTYTDQWFGDLVVYEKSGDLYVESKRSKLLKGKLNYYKGSTYVARWDDRSLDADAFFVFSLDPQGKTTGIKVSAISPLTDFSFDFQDLDFKRKNEK